MTALAIEPGPVRARESVVKDMTTTTVPTTPDDVIRALPACLQTERLELRPLRIKDADDLASGADNAKVARMTGTFATPYLPHAAAMFIMRQPSFLRRSLGRNWAIVSDDRLVGCIGVFRNDENARWGSVWEVGYWLAEDVWGFGFATEALRAVMASTDAPVVGRVFFDNPDSVHVLEKAGFVSVGKDAGHCIERQSVVEGVVLLRGGSLA